MARPSLLVGRLARAAAQSNTLSILPRTNAVQVRAFTAAPALQKHARTGLYDFHVKNGGKMVPFGGYDMPLSYGTVGQSECILLVPLFVESS
jgi:hypothetical protein